METTPARRLRFTIRELFLVVLVVALAVGWAIDHWRFVEQQKVSRKERRYITRLTEGDAKVGITKDELQAALGAPHRDHGTYWVYLFEAKDDGHLMIFFDDKDQVSLVQRGS
jgi:hypothetical protein